MGTDMTVNPKGREALLDAYKIGSKRRVDLAAVDEAVRTGDTSALSGVAADLAELQAAMKPKKNPPPTT